MVCKGPLFINHLNGKIEMNFNSPIGVRPWKTLRIYGLEKQSNWEIRYVTMHPDAISCLPDYTVLESTVLLYGRWRRTGIFTV